MANYCQFGLLPKDIWTEVLRKMTPSNVFKQRVLNSSFKKISVQIINDIRTARIAQLLSITDCPLEKMVEGKEITQIASISKGI